MLSNAYFLAKFRFDTAENEPAKNLQKFANFPNFPNFANPNPKPLKGPAEDVAAGEGGPGHRRPRRGSLSVAPAPPGEAGNRRAREEQVRERATSYMFSNFDSNCWLIFCKL